MFAGLLFDRKVIVDNNTDVAVVSIDTAPSLLQVRSLRVVMSFVFQQQFVLNRRY